MTAQRAAAEPIPGAVVPGTLPPVSAPGRAAWGWRWEGAAKTSGRAVIVTNQLAHCRSR
jgi:hypothetical protein